MEQFKYLISQNFKNMDKYKTKLMFYSFDKIKETGDEVKIKYVKTLISYFFIFNKLNEILKSNDILTEKKYHCEDFYHYLDDNVIDNSKRIISDIIVSIAFDLPLDTFHKYLMRPYIYGDEHEIESIKKDFDF